jgi:hypothetical protein
MSENKNDNGGIDLASLLFITFLVLKLTKVITWSWWWVTSPLWIPLIIGLIFVIILGIFTSLK